MTDRSYIGKGSIYTRDRSGSGGLMPIGNVSALNVSFEEEKKELKDYTSASGGNANVLTSITSMTGSMTMYDFSAANLAFALRGSVTAVTAGAIVDEAHTCAGIDGELIPFSFSYDSSIAPVITGPAGTPTYTLDTDYTMGTNGIIVMGAGAIGATGIEASYTKVASEVMQALVESGAEFELYFDGLNEAQTGKAVAIQMHRIKFSPAQGLDFIGDDFGEINTDFEVLSDSSVVAAGLSKFMNVSQAL